MFRSEIYFAEVISDTINETSVPEIATLPTCIRLQKLFVGIFCESI